MSIVVLTVGAAHALPILLTAIVSQRRSATLIAAVVMTAIALATGAFKFFGIDLLFIVIGTWVGFNICSSKKGN